MTESNKDYKLMAALAHAGIIVFGVLIALVVWLTQKEKSKYVSFQALQAMVYQLVVFVGFFVLGIASFVFTTVLAIITGGLGGILTILLFPLFLVLALVTVVYGLYGAYQCYEGKDFKYFFIGDFLEKKA